MQAPNPTVPGSSVNTLLSLPGLDLSRLSVLPDASSHIIQLLLMGKLDPSLDPSTRPEWQQWWSQPQAQAWGPVLPMRSLVRSLGQRMRSYAEVGLDSVLRDRPMSDPPLNDIGVLGRLAGMGWGLGLSRALDRLAELPKEVALPMWTNAVAQAVDCNQEAAVIDLVQWASSKSWIGQEAGLSAQLVGRAWKLLLSSSSSRSNDELDMILDQVVAISPVRPGTPAEVSLWKALFDDRHPDTVALAVNAWCKRYPSAWTRLHDKALVDDTIPNAWLVACEHALREGVDCALWKTALASPTLPAWLSRHGWSSDPQGSPLACWWVRWIDIVESRDPGKADPSLRAGQAPLPGSDLVSDSLRAAGAIEPGSQEDRQMGSRCFAAMVAPARSNPAWFADRPQWVYNDPATGSNPIFTATRYSEFDHWIQVGFDPSAINSRGDMAAYVFLGRAMVRSRKQLSKHVVDWFESGTVPAVGKAHGRVSAQVVCRLKSEDASFAWLRSRIKDATPLSPQETSALAAEASAPVVLAWIKALDQSSSLDGRHIWALWSELLYRDRAEDGLVWEEVEAIAPMQDVPDLPLWLGVWTQGPNRSPHEVAHALEQIPQNGLEMPTVNHACWKERDVAAKFAHTIAGLDRERSICVIPPDADVSWWASMLDRALSSVGDHGGALLTSSVQMQGWIYAGLPLEGRVLEVLQSHRASCHPDCTWSDLPAIVAPLQAQELSRGTPNTIHQSPRRF